MTSVPLADKIRVLVVDDHQLVRAGLIGLLSAHAQIDVVGEASDGEQAIAAALELRPDVILMDLSMPNVDGITATRTIVGRLPTSRIVALTSFSDRQRVTDVLSAGAVGYLLKDCTPEELLSAVRSAAAGHTPVDPRVASALLPSRTPDPADVLSEREQEVLTLAAKGMANKQIGRALGISESTVKVHLSNVFKRIGVSDRTSAAMWAKENLPG